jgi:hypothetical protein
MLLSVEGCPYRVDRTGGDETPVVVDVFAAQNPIPAHQSATVTLE